MPTSAWEQAVPLSQRILSDEHRQVLEEESGIDPDIHEGRGYYSPTRAQMMALVLAGAVHDRLLKAESWLSIPTYLPDGEKHGEVLRVFGSTSLTKYVWGGGFSGTRNALIVHPDFYAEMHDPTIPIIFAEGVKKGDAILSAARREGIEVCVISINGNYGWRSKTEDGSSIASPDFLDIPMHHRQIYTTPDSDFRTNDLVRKGWSELAQYLSSKTGSRHVYVAVVPPYGLERQGADDYLVRGGTLHDLLGSATTPTYAVSEQPLDQAPPLVVKSARMLIEEAITPVPHLIAPILPEESIMVLAGHSGSYKTWHGLQLCLDGALGMNWLGHPELSNIDPFSTLYVNKEMGSKMLGQRLRAIARNDRYAKHSDYERVIEERVFFTDDSTVDLIEEQQRIRLEEAILYLGVRLVVLDSFSMCWTGDENSSSEVGRFYAHLRGITERTGVAWTLIHHLLKPAGIRKNEHIQFSVRGSGQIMQQADAALILAPVDSEVHTSDTRSLSIIHAKARTSLELAGFISAFNTNSGEYVSMKYAGQLTDMKSKVAAEAKGDPKKMTDWIKSALVTMSAMSPKGSGIRSKQLMTLLTMHWTGSTDAPSESTLRQRLDELATAGDLEVIANDKKNGGKLYRFSAGEHYDAALTLAANKVQDLLESSEESGED